MHLATSLRKSNKDAVLYSLSSFDIFRSVTLRITITQVVSPFPSISGETMQGDVWKVLEIPNGCELAACTDHGPI